jgi:mercuric ion transport protein
MIKTKLENTVAIGSSILTVIAPKFCCWSSAIAATSTSSSYLAWAYPMRPYLMGLAGISLGFSFYKAYKPKTSNYNCKVCTSKKGFFQSKLYLWLILAFVLISFIISYVK